MYETPKLQLVGMAQEVILGIFSAGDDLDGYLYPVELDFAEDAPPSETVTASIATSI